MALQNLGLLSASQPLANILGQQTDNQYWGDLSSIGYKPSDFKKWGIADRIKQAAQRLGYSGSQAGPQDLGQLAQLLGMSESQLAERQNTMLGSWMKDGDTTKRDSELANALQQEYADQSLLKWLADQGMSVNAYDNGRENVQQLVGPNGERVAVDAYNYYNDNKAGDRLAIAGALMLGGAALSGAGAFGGGASAGGAGGGISTLSPSLAGTAPTLTTASLPTGMTAGMTGGSSLSYLPSAAQAFAGAGGLATLSGGAAPAITTQSIPTGLTAGMTGGSGIAPALTSAEVLGGGSGLLGQLSNTGVGKAVGTVADAVGGGKNLAGIVGGLAGAMEGGKSQTATSMQQIDPRMAQYLYGSGYGDANSMLGAAQQWFQNNRSGMNANMQQGLDTLKNLYTSPGYTQGYTQMRDVGQGLLGRSIAGNPFTQGGLLGAPMQQPMQQPIQARPEIGAPPPSFGSPTMQIGGGNFRELNPPGPDVGIPQFPRPAWSI